MNEPESNGTIEGRTLMPDSTFYLDSASYAALVELMGRRRAIAPWSILIVFEPGVSPAVYSNGSASSLLPVLQEVTQRLEAGSLRMPLTPDTLRWVEEPISQEGSQFLGTMGVDEGLGEKEDG